MHPEKTIERSILRRAYSPYFREAKRVLGVLLLISIGIICLDPILGTIQQNNDHAWLFAAITVMVPFAFLSHILFVINVPWLSFIDRLTKRFVVQEVQMIWIQAARDSLSKEGRTIPKLYEKGMNVDKYIIGCVDKDGKSIRLRSAMSEEKLELFAQLPIDGDTVRTRLIYGKFSRVIIKYEDPREGFQRLNEML